MTKFKVQKLVAPKGRTAAGQADKRIGEVWETIGTYKNRAVAERTWKHAQIDNPNGRIRLEEIA